MENRFWHHAVSPGASKPLTVQINDRVSVRLYPDCRPNCLETSPLQKGLVLLLDGEELVEEGVGFGVPVVKYKDKTYFSGSAKTWLQNEKNRCIIVKSFTLDTISRKRVGSGSYLSDYLYHFLHRSFEIGYLNHPELALISNKIIELRKTLKIQTEFTKVKPRGTVTFRYSCYPDEIHIAIEFTLLELDRCKEILVLNEQGANFFRRFADSSGIVLFDRKIGPWAKVEAEEACFSDLKQTLTFTMKKKFAARLFRGWEKTKGRFSWAGFAYFLPPRTSTFCYSLGGWKS